MTAAGISSTAVMKTIDLQSEGEDQQLDEEVLENNNEF